MKYNPPDYAGIVSREVHNSYNQAQCDIWTSAGFIWVGVLYDPERKRLLNYNKMEWDTPSHYNDDGTKADGYFNIYYRKDYRR